MSKTVQDDPKDEGEALIWTTPSQHDCRREIRGSLHPRFVSRKFDDAELLPGDCDYRISRMVFRYFEEHIVQLQVDYVLLGEGKECKQVVSFTVGTHYHSVREAVLNFSDY